MWVHTVLYSVYWDLCCACAHKKQKASDQGIISLSKNVKCDENCAFVNLWEEYIN